jgi:hypothetical protein
VFTYNEVFWLNVTNLVLGVATVVCLLVIGYVAFKEIREHAKARKGATEEVAEQGFGVSQKLPESPDRRNQDSG